LSTGDRDQNLQRAIACCEAALRVRTESDFPSDWATTQINLGNAYSELPTGNRSENLRRAIACYEAALRVCTESDFPADWAATQFYLGLAYQDLGQFPESVVAFERAERGYRGVGDLVQADEAKVEAETSLRRQDPPSGA
jgi:tetratricopeptide (TPR) repeat protein